MLMLKRGVHFGLKCQCFTMKNRLFSSEKSVFCHEKGDHFKTGEQGWVSLFSVSEGAGAKVRYCIMFGN